MRRKNRKAENPAPIDAPDFMNQMIAALIARDHPGSLPGAWVLSIEIVCPDGSHRVTTERPVTTTEEFASALLISAARTYTQ